MAPMNTEKFRIMQDEMSRFEEEIGLPIDAQSAQRIVIGTATFSQAERQINEISGRSGPDVVPPPPPPPPFVPPQVLHRPHLAQEEGMPLPPMPPFGAPSVSIPGLPVSVPQSVASMPYPQRPPVMPYGGRMPNFCPSTVRFNPRGMPRPGMHVPYYSNTSTFNSRSGTGSVSSSQTKPVETPVVVSATPKLYNAPKTEGQDNNKTGNAAKIPSAESSKETKKQKTSGKEGDSQNSQSNEGTPHTGKKKEKKPKKFIRVSGGQTWEDSSLTEWEDGDFRLFCGDLGNDVTDELLTRTFSIYPSFLKAKVVRDKRTNKTKGYGFVSFKDPQDFIRATKEMNGRYVGSRPIKLRKSTWRNRNIDIVKKKEKEKAALLALLTGKS